MAIRLSHSCFNPRARKGRDIGTRGHFQHGHVSIHAPARGATPLDRLTRQTMPFQSTRPQGARRLGALDGALGDEFQSTRPQGARLRQSSAMIFVVCFNPRARKGRDQGGRRGREAHGVSIHAPARGATGHGRGHGPVQVVSIHAPARGATCPRKLADALHEFQSTRPQGARLAQELRHYAVYGVSIHAPARGATLAEDLRDAHRGVSIHAPARGATLRSRSTPHRRHVSIHAPARGATVAEFALAIVSLFQSTRPQGARLLDEMDIAIEQLFQSTRPQGARRSESPSSPAPTRFNPRARKGRDVCTRPCGAGGSRVSIHAPARGATTETAFSTVIPSGFNPRARKGRDLA